MPQSPLAWLICAVAFAGLIVTIGDDLLARRREKRRRGFGVTLKDRRE